MNASTSSRLQRVAINGLSGSAGGSDILKIGRDENECESEITTTICVDKVKRKRLEVDDKRTSLNFRIQRDTSR